MPDCLLNLLTEVSKKFFTEYLVEFSFHINVYNIAKDKIIKSSQFSYLPWKRSSKLVKNYLLFSKSYLVSAIIMSSISNLTSFFCIHILQDLVLLTSNAKTCTLRSRVCLFPISGVV